MLLRHLDRLTPEGVSHDPEILKRVFLRSGDVAPVLQYAVTRFEPGQVASEHDHTGMVELFYCLEGRGSARVDGEAHELRRGTLLVCEPGDRHEIRSADDAAMTVLVVALATEP